MSSGASGPLLPFQILLDIKAHSKNSGGVTASVAGDGTSSCSLTGGTNTQGRFTNGSSNPCKLCSDHAQRLFYAYRAIAKTFVIIIRCIAS
ncbi:MAG: hypothetical protein R3C26_21975 [Calditrichia bacterium]